MMGEKSMFQEERLAAIMEHLRLNKRIEVEEICDLLNVSRDTARRDIIKLEERGSIIRTRGGAILPTLSKEMPTYEQRLQKATASSKGSDAWPPRCCATRITCMSTLPRPCVIWGIYDHEAERRRHELH